MLKNYLFISLVILGIVLTTLYWAHMSRSANNSLHPPLFAHARTAFRPEAHTVWEG